MVCRLHTQNTFLQRIVVRNTCGGIHIEIIFRFDFHRKSTWIRNTSIGSTLKLGHSYKYCLHKTYSFIFVILMSSQFYQFVASYSAAVLSLFLVNYLSLSTVSVPLTCAPKKRHVSHPQAHTHTHVYSVKSCYCSSLPGILRARNTQIKLNYSRLFKYYKYYLFELNENGFSILFTCQIVPNEKTNTSSLALYFQHTEV